MKLFGLGCVVVGLGGVLVQRPSGIVFWNCLGRDVDRGPSPHSSCASTLERSFVMLFRLSFLGATLGQVLPQFLCEARCSGSCGRPGPLFI